MDKNSKQLTSMKARLMLVLGLFENQTQATRAVEKLIDDDFPTDRISLLHKAAGLGDDMLGLSYSNNQQRVKVWGKHGLFWGALWGLLAGVSGMFVLPGIGVVLAAGPIVDLLGGAVAGATIGGGVMAGAAIVTELASALHELGIPKEKLAFVHKQIEQGHYLVILHCDNEEKEQNSSILKRVGADSVMTFPILL